MFSKKIVTINMEADSVRALAVNGKVIEKWGSIPLETGIVRDGLVLQPEAASQAINILFENLRISKKNVFLNLTGLRATFRTLTLPHVKPSMLEESIRRGAKREMPVSLEELYLAWETVCRSQDDQDFFILGMPRELVDASVNTLARIGIKAPVIDFKPLALARLVNRRNAIIIDLESDSFTITLVAEGMPAVIRTATPKGKASILEDHIARLNEEITRIVEFHNRSHRDNAISHDTPILMTGSLADNRTISEAIAKGVDYPVEQLSIPFKFPEKFPLATYAANTGLASRGILPKVNRNESTAGFYDITLNMLPVKHRPRTVPIKYAFACLVPILALGGLLPVHKTVSSFDATTLNLQATLEDLNYQLDEINRVTQAQTNVENNIQLMETQAEVLRDQVQAVTSSESDFGATTQVILDSTPSGIQLKSIKLTTSQITLNGNANDVSTVISYAKALENIDVFNGVFITNLGNKFAIVIDR